MKILFIVVAMALLGGCTLDEFKKQMSGIKIKIGGVPNCNHQSQMYDYQQQGNEVMMQNQLRCINDNLSQINANMQR